MMNLIIYIKSMNYNTIYKFSAIILMVFLVSCAEKPMDAEKSKELAEAHINAADAGDYKKLEELYAPEFLGSEPMDAKIEKLEQQLKQQQTAINELKKFLCLQNPKAEVCK